MLLNDAVRCDAHLLFVWGCDLAHEHYFNLKTTSPHEATPPKTCSKHVVLLPWCLSCLNCQVTASFTIRSQSIDV